MSWKSKRAVGPPERPLGELKPAGQPLDRFALDQPGKPGVSQDRRHRVNLPVNEPDSSPPTTAPPD